MADIEINTTRYEREHGHPPAGRKFWRFVLISDTITVKDHWLNLDDKQRTYPDALEEAKRIAGLRKSVRIIVEP
jgi:hypothetical protein